MMDIRMVEDLEDIVLTNEIEKLIQKSDATPSDIHNLLDGSCLIEKLYKIAGKSEEMMNEYSQRSRYNDGNSYRYGRSSYRRSYLSGDNGNRVMHKLNEALDMASTEEEKNAIRDIINRMSH